MLDGGDQPPANGSIGIMLDLFQASIIERRAILGAGVETRAVFLGEGLD